MVPIAAAHNDNFAAMSAFGIVTLTKNKPNLLLDHEAKPLKMSISTIGESPRFRCESD